MFNTQRPQFVITQVCGTLGLQIPLMDEVSGTSASQIVESFWNIWSQVTIKKAM